MNQVRLVCDDRERVARLFINVAPPGWHRLEDEIILRSQEDEKKHMQHVQDLSEEDQETLLWFWHDITFPL